MPQPTTDAERERWRSTDSETLRSHQLAKLNRLLLDATANQAFYKHKYRGIKLPLESLDALLDLPLLEKGELMNGGVAAICGLAANRYVRLHQTSGTCGDPLRVLDTADDWQWWLDCWQYVLDAANVGVGDVAMMAFSYGPFIGFWTAHESCVARGATVIPGGGMDSVSRLKMMIRCGATIVCCTPTYALHLATVAEEHGIEIKDSPVSRIIVAGEPGGSIPSVRQRIESLWGARLVDHCGATELGAWGVGSRDGRGIHGIESEFIAECLVFDGQSPSGRPAQNDQLSELVLTGLGRFGAPAIRYRTGDLVRPQVSSDCENRFLFLAGGVLGRVDNMVVVRGVNVFPSSIEAIVRRVAGDAEYRVLQSERDSMIQLRVEIETASDACELPGRLSAALREHLGLRIDVRPIARLSLPRFEAKARRWIRESETC
jgi:phenylacetate-CoA ligase